jgi:hypothetical protein
MRKLKALEADWYSLMQESDEAVKNRPCEGPEVFYAELIALIPLIKAYRAMGEDFYGSFSLQGLKHRRSALKIACPGSVGREEWRTMAPELYPLRKHTAGRWANEHAQTVTEQEWHWRDRITALERQGCALREKECEHYRAPKRSEPNQAQASRAMATMARASA